MTESKAQLGNYALEPKVLLDTSIKTKSLVGVSVTLKDKNPQSVIKLIGDALGIHDYETNIASFWFLDFVALQILLFDNELDDNAKSVLIGWLAGEMQLIRETKLSHEAFWRRMKEIFDKCSKQSQPLLHWELIVRDDKFNDLVSVEGEKESRPSREQGQTTGMTGSRASTKSQRKMISSRNRSRQSVRSLQKSKTEKLENSNNVKSNSKPQVLDVVKEATYNMYGDIFHYSLIVAAFLEPIFILDYELPYKLRVPRPIKIFNDEKSKKIETAVGPRGSKDVRKKTGEKIINQSRDNTKSNDPIKDPVVLSDDDILMEQRRFILPLMEANEADSVLKEYKQEYKK